MSQSQQVDDLDVSLGFIKIDEGGYAERAIEPGGAVNLGISFAEFRSWRKLCGKPAPTFADLKDLQWAEARAIYEKNFAVPCHFNDMATGVNYCSLDSCINNGVGGMSAHFRSALGLPYMSGKGRLLPFTVDVLERVKSEDPVKMVQAFCDARLRRQRTFRDYDAPVRAGSKHTFGEVWDRRVGLVRERSLSMIQSRKLKTTRETAK